jgi:biopolymer transport protein ExbD
MAHGPAAQGSSADPNLTPLLDMVLQLLMFFMMCVNFVSEQVSEDVKLPASTTARLMDKDVPDVLFLNVKPYKPEDFRSRYRPEDLSKFQEGDTCVLTLARPPMKLREAQYFLKQHYEDAARNARDGRVRTAVVLRAHQDTQYEQIYRLLQMCKAVGYRDLHLRAMSKGGGPRR